MAKGSCGECIHFIPRCETMGIRKGYCKKEDDFTYLHFETNKKECCEKENV